MHYDNILQLSETWLEYAIKIHIGQESTSSLQALQDKKIQGYLQDIRHFHSTLVTNHKNPSLPIHKLLFLLELGFDTNVKEIQLAINEIQKHKDEQGIYQSLTKIPKHFGGTGEALFSWCLCDAPLLLLALVKAEVGYEEHIQKGVEYLLSLYQSNGYPCTVSHTLGRFRGPGKKSDCCPYATLVMLRLLVAIPEYRKTRIVHELSLTLLSLWENSLEQHPYMFYMGNDFRKLKAPNHWYDIVSVTYIVSQVEAIRDDPRFQEMVHYIKERADEKGMYTPTSIYQKVKDWDFGQKKKVSPYLTYMCYIIFENVYG